MKNRLVTYYNTAVWKLDTPFENWLSYKADKYEFFKKLYVLYYIIFDNEYYKKGLGMFDEVLEDFKSSNSREELTASDKWLRRDFIYSQHRFGVDFYEYFIFEFFHLNTAGREEFITNKKRYYYYHLLNDDENFMIFENKRKTYEIFGEYYGRDFLAVESIDDIEAFLFFSSNNNTFVFKPIAGAEGKGIEIITLASAEQASEFFNSKIAEGPFVVEELIVQDERMASLSKRSVNTVRVPSIICQGEVKIFHPFLRMGFGDSVVDNNSSGGIAASIDSETGIVYTKGRSKNGNWYLKHPDTGTTIVGFQIPEWDKLVELTAEITTMVPGTRYIAWDLALTREGWIVVEGNALGAICPMQGQDKVGRKRELLELIALGE